MLYHGQKCMAVDFSGRPSAKGDVGIRHGTLMQNFCPLEVCIVFSSLEILPQRASYKQYNDR